MAAAAARVASPKVAAHGTSSSFIAPLLSMVKHRIETPQGFTSKIFKVDTIQLADKTESIVRGGRNLFPLLPKAFAGVKQVGVIGWGSQGPAQSLNLKESLAGSGINVKVGLRPSSKAFVAAERAGFDPKQNGLGAMLDVIHESDLSILLISDAAAVTEHKKVFDAMRPGTFLGLSHGFLLGHLDSVKQTFPSDIGVIAVCPKGMGPSVRQLYEQGREVNGSGINSSFAVHQDVDGRGTDLALGWSIGIGSPVTFQTTLDSEYKSDIFGERGILLGAVHGIAEVIYRHFTRSGMPQKEAYMRCVEGIVRPISSIISKEGIDALYHHFEGEARAAFELAYTAAYGPVMEILQECYEDVVGGREIPSVIDRANKLDVFPFTKIDSTELWSVAESVRSAGVKDADVPLDPLVAGIYSATIMAQCAILMTAGHAYSEVANESVIEAVDSLNPFMRFKGVAYMVDNCSTTAKLGARKWAPRFDYIIDQQVLPRIQNQSFTPEQVSSVMAEFKSSKMHEVLRVCAGMRPPVDIVPRLTHLG